jgi:hypothetical protein
VREVEEEARILEPIAILSKPIDLGELRTALEKVADGIRAEARPAESRPRETVHHD